MLRFLSTKSFFGSLAGLLFAVALIGVVWEYARERTQRP